MANKLTKKETIDRLRDFANSLEKGKDSYCDLGELKLYSGANCRIVWGKVDLTETINLNFDIAGDL